MERISKDVYFMLLAEVVSLRATCLRHKIGSVVVTDGEVQSSGYNGAPRNMQHCIDGECIRDIQKIESGTQIQQCRGCHSEWNSINQAGSRARGGTLYVTHQPCVVCSKLAINAGIKRIVYIHEYQDQLAVKMLGEAGVALERMTLDTESLDLSALFS